MTKQVDLNKYKEFVEAVTSSESGNTEALANKIRNLEEESGVNVAVYTMLDVAVNELRVPLTTVISSSIKSVVASLDVKVKVRIRLIIGSATQTPLSSIEPSEESFHSHAKDSSQV